MKKKGVFTKPKKLMIDVCENERDMKTGVACALVPLLGVYSVPRRTMSGTDIHTWLLG